MSPTATPPSLSVEQALARLARHNRLRPGDPILRGGRFAVAYGGQSAPGTESYLLLEDGHIVQRREVRLDPNQFRRSVGGYVGDRHLEHHLRADDARGLVGEVEDQATRERVDLELCIQWPGPGQGPAATPPRSTPPAGTGEPVVTGFSLRSTEPQAVHGRQR